MHQRENAFLFDVELVVAQTEQAVPPAGAAAKGVDCRSEAAQHGIVIGRQFGHALFHRLQQVGIAADRMGIHEDRQLHQAVTVGHDEPLARHQGEACSRVAPIRVVDHDVTSTFGIAKAGQGRREAVANVGQIVWRRIAVAQHQTVVLIGLEQLLAPTLAAHHKQATVLDQVCRCNQVPGALEQARVELLHQPGNQIDARAASMQKSNHAGNLGCGLAQALQGLGILDFFGDQVRLVGQKAEQIQRLQNTVDFLVVIHHHHPVHAVAQHDGHGIAQLIRGLDLDQLEVAQVAHRQLVERASIQNGTLHGRGGKDAQALWLNTAVAHQHIGGALGLKGLDHRKNAGRCIDKYRRAQEGFVHA